MTSGHFAKNLFLHYQPKAQQTVKQNVFFFLCKCLEKSVVEGVPAPMTPVVGSGMRVLIR